MRKQIMLILMTVGLVCTLTVGGALAAFNDSETSDSNTVTAGTLDLVVNGENPLKSILVDLDNMKPGECRTVDVQLTNEGSMAGDSWMMFTNMICTTGAFVEPEVAAEAGVPVDDISSQMTISINGVEMGTMADINNNVIDLITLEPAGNNGAGMTVTISFLFSADAGNEYQGDTCEFSLVFGINQQAMGDTETTTVS